MKVFLTILIGTISFLTYGQENTITSITIAWEQLNTPLSLVKEESKAVDKYKLIEIDLSIDLREQYYMKKNTAPIMYLPRNKFVSTSYNIAIPQPKTGSIGFTVSGNGYNSNNNAGGIKNTAYKDASLYSGAFCPITGLAY
ncbi:hypothetical protein [Aquimarina sp. 2304DJ70-9]|uniref:hypothetical protein n=1 Tax=Aquimarina penaris TaxID=3231044 RepID=UPI0034637746